MANVYQKQMRRRSEIIEKALHLMESTPFSKLSIRDICKAANISTGRFYHYFNSKSDLLVGLFGLIDIELEEQVFPLLTDENELENLKILSRAFAAHVEKNGLERSKLISGCCPSDRDIEGNIRPLWLKVTEIVSRGQEKGQITTIYPAETITDLLLIALRGVAVDWSRRDGSYSLKERMEQFTNLFLSGLGK
mgnify:FL=1